MNKKTLFKILGIVMSVGGALVAAKSTDIELEELVDKKFRDKEREKEIKDFLEESEDE